VRDYVDFNAITTTTPITNVLGGNGPAVDMDVTVVMAFNPAQAEAHTYAQLRQMTTRAQFETLIARDVRDIVHKYFRLLTPASAAQRPAQPARARRVYHRPVRALPARWAYRWPPADR